MNAAFGVRLRVLVAALIVVAGGTIYGLSAAWRQVQELEAKLSSSQIERFRLAGQIQRGLLNLNDSMLHYALVRAPEQWKQFEQASKELDLWLDEHDPAHNPNSPVATAAERRLFTELNQAYDDYLLSARQVHSNAVPALVTPAQLAELDGFEVQAQRMRDLARQLADAHRTAEAGFLANADNSLAILRGILTGSIMLLLALVAAVGWVIYRDTIAPLRTKLVQSQGLLERQEKLATLGTLAAGIAHEIRNPLTSLKARLYTLQKHLQGVPAARKDTEIIGAEISRLERIVQDVLNFARPSEPSLQPVDAGKLLHDVQALMAPDLRNRSVRLVLEPAPAVRVNADPGLLKQVLVNLVRNAADAIEGSGTVALRARAGRAPFAAGERDAVILEVADTGKGIPPEVERRLFDPFFSTKETGTGLGLSIAARIVQSHGGMLQYQTRPGHGTTFGVVLPGNLPDTPAGTANES